MQKPAKARPFKTKRGYMRLGKRLHHRVVMEEVIGRPLKQGETVHHRNGVKDDNRPENLELRVSRHPQGQSVEDLVNWARAIIADYESVVEKLP